MFKNTSNLELLEFIVFRVFRLKDSFEIRAVAQTAPEIHSELVVTPFKRSGQWKSYNTKKVGSVHFAYVNDFI